MNVSHLPGGSLANAVRSIQDRIGAAQQEMTTGRLADPVSQLGAGRGRTISLEAQAERLDRVRETNTLTIGRLDVTAIGLGNLADTSGGLVETLVAVVGGALDRDFAFASAKGARVAVTAALNGTFAGQYVFAGITSDVEPIRDGDAAQAALEARFPALLPGSGATTPQNAAVLMADALAWLTDEGPGGGWSLVSVASDVAVAARIAPGERADVSVSANAAPARSAFAAAFLAERLFASDLGDAAVASASEVLVGHAASAGAGLAGIEGGLGLVQARVANANSRLAEDADHLRGIVAETLAVDPFEAAQRFNASVTQLETAYALTGRLNQLSLMRFL